MSERLRLDEFKKIAKTYLGDIDLCNLLGRGFLKTDEKGFMPDKVLKDIKISLWAAIIMASDGTMKSNCQSLLNFLNKTE